MAPVFSVETTARFDRELHKLIRRHPELADYYDRARLILEVDPYNRSRTRPIRKLEGGETGRRPVPYPPRAISVPL